MRRTPIRLSSLPPTLRSILSPQLPVSSSLAQTAAVSNGEPSSSSSSSARDTTGDKVGGEGDTTTTTTTTVHGWIKSIRAHKNVTFLEINDGSQVQSLQAVLKGKGKADGLTNGSSVQLKGKLGKSRGAGQAVELLIDDLKVLGECDPEVYPIQKKSLPPAVLRDHAHLRFRTTQTAAVMRVRDAQMRDWHDWFEDNGFVHIHTPILTGSDCEGAGEVFTLQDPGAASHSPVASSSSSSSFPDLSPIASSSSQPQSFFPHPVHLTVSSQLHLEAPTHALSRTYTLSPSFRAEPSLTSRHLSEFYMLEAEVAWIDDLDTLLDVVENGVKSAVGRILSTTVEDRGRQGRSQRTRHDLEAIAQSLLAEEDHPTTSQHTITPHDSLEHLRQVSARPFTRITYTSALDILNDLHEQESFIQAPPKWGESIATEHEKRLAQHLGGPVFVTRYPRAIKPFYMLPSSTSITSARGEGEEGRDKANQRETVECFDLLFPQWGEMAGGSLREHRLVNLIESIDRAQMKKEDYQWYLDLRRFGSVPHGGWGMGWDRWICWVTGVNNIRDVVPYPRWKGHCKY